jgi:hypothetical protein
MSLTCWWMEAAEMNDHVERSSRFLALQQNEQPLLLPNPWDRGSAGLLAWLGFQALATTSSGFAATLGRPRRAGDPEGGDRARGIDGPGDRPGT